MKCRLIREMESSRERDPLNPERNATLPAGTVLDDPQAFRLVQMGCAEPADEECVRAAAVTPQQFEAAKAAYEKVSRGIHPDDYAAWDAGWMRGYNPDGTWIPGPNYAEYEAQCEDLDED